MSATPEVMNGTSAAATETTTGPKIAERAKPATEEFGIRLSEKAGNQIREIIRKDNYPATMYLFVGVKGGGCSGLQYVLDLRDETHAAPAETDEVFSSQGVAIVCDLKSYVVGNLNGTMIDYQDGLMGAGFTFNNPHAKHTCGCGSSYSA